MHEQTGQTIRPARPAPPRAARAALASASAGAAGVAAAAEHLEQRALFAVTAPVELSVAPNVNISRTFSNQNSGTIAIDPSDPARLFAASNMDDSETGPLDPDVNGNSTFTAVSNDAGVTWEAQLIGTGADGFAVACCDPSAAFDEFGNLFYAYTGTDEVTGDPAVELLVSTDGGRTFRNVYRFVADDIIQPTVTTAGGTVWVSFGALNLDNSFFYEQYASGARVLGLNTVQTFIPEQIAPRSANGLYGDIEIGPNGEVLVTYQLPGGPGGRVESIYVNVDPDGLGPQTFSRRFEVTSTSIERADAIPAQDDRTVDAEVSLAWDRSGGAFNGRVYAVYNDEPRDEAGNDLNVYLRFSDDNGATWSSPRQVNSQDFGQRTQFLPKAAVDQTSGNVAVVWHDTRIEPGISFGDNDEVTVWGTAGVPTIGEQGVVFAENVPLSRGVSDAHRARARVEYGDYLGLDYRNNVFHAAWADNSNSTGDNPSGGVGSALDLATLDLYTARVTVTPVAPAADPLRPIGPGSPLSPEFLGKDTINKGKVYKFRVQYESPSGVDASSLGDDDLLVTGPNGFNLFADFLKAKPSKRGTIVTGTYQIAAPGGKFDEGDNGLYSLLLQAGAVRDLGGVSITAGLLNQFFVSATAPRQAPALLPAAAPQSASLLSADRDDSEDDDKLAAVGLA